MRLGVPAASPAKWGAPGPPPAVTETGEALRFAHDGQRTDRDVVLQAVKQYGTALEFAGEGLEAGRQGSCPAGGDRDRDSIAVRP